MSHDLAVELVKTRLWASGYSVKNYTEKSHYDLLLNGQVSVHVKVVKSATAVKQVPLPSVGDINAIVLPLRFLTPVIVYVNHKGDVMSSPTQAFSFIKLKLNNGDKKAGPKK